MKTDTVVKAKKPWPTKAAMEQIYEAKLWGDNGENFYSGDGSHHPELVQPYVDRIQSFLKSFENPLTVIDLGCGDFNVGVELVDYSKKYIAVDIVDDLVKFNQDKFQHPNLEFYCLDIAKDNLPTADCVVLRQVLQHLSNSEINRIVSKLYVYQYVVLTEHLPLGDFTPNMDIISGQGTRLKKQSGVNLCEAPFQFKPIELKQVVSLDVPNHGGKLITTLFQMF
ncbi:MAG: class I SAM-dependent methyltransferase [Bacteroidota bacterium]